MSTDELCQLVTNLLQTVTARESEITFKQTTIDKLTHENTMLKHLKFAAQSERFSADQRSLLEETVDEELQAVRGSATHRDSPRTRLHHLHLWLSDATHR